MSAKKMGGARKKKKASPKVRLSTAGVVIMSCVIFFACALFLSLDFLVTRAQTAPAVPIVWAEKKAALASEPVSGEGSGAAQEKEKTPLVQEKSAGGKQNEHPADSRAAPVETQNKTPEKKETRPVHQAGAQSAQKPAGTKIPAIPNSAKNEPRTEKKFGFEQSNGAKLCFVIDDAGENVENVRAYTSLPFPITIAVLPRVSHSKECADNIRAAGKEIILHQPMQAKNAGINPGEGAIKADMGEADIVQTLVQNIERIGPVKGLNNHEGSLITSDFFRIGAVLDVCRAKGIYFIDSRTAVASENAVGNAAAARGMRFLERNAPFLDNTVEREAMLEELYKCLAVANRDGYAIIIGHVDKSVHILPQLLREAYPELLESGYTVTTPSLL